MTLHEVLILHQKLLRKGGKDTCKNRNCCCGCWEPNRAPPIALSDGFRTWTWSLPFLEDVGCPPQKMDLLPHNGLSWYPPPPPPLGQCLLPPPSSSFRPRPLHLLFWTSCFVPSPRVERRRHLGAGGQGKGFCGTSHRSHLTLYPKLLLGLTLSDRRLETLMWLRWEAGSGSWLWRSTTASRGVSWRWLPSCLTAAWENVFGTGFIHSNWKITDGNKVLHKREREDINWWSKKV